MRSVFSGSHNQLLILELEGYRRNILIIAHSPGRCVPVLHLQVLGERNDTAGIHSAGRIGSPRFRVTKNAVPSGASTGPVSARGRELGVGRLVTW